MKISIQYKHYNDQLLIYAGKLMNLDNCFTIKYKNVIISKKN